jgi:hypothetical protein
MWPQRMAAPQDDGVDGWDGVNPAGEESTEPLVRKEKNGASDMQSARPFALPLELFSLNILVQPQHSGLRLNVAQHLGA